MNPSSISFKALSSNAKLPQRHSAGAAGYDLHTISSGTIEPFALVSLRTGFSLSIPFDLFGKVLGRSGLAIKNGIEIKASYAKNNEEIIVNVYNSSAVPFTYEEGMRIAQLVFLRVDYPEYVCA